MEQTIEFRYDTQLLLDKYGIDDDECDDLIDEIRDHIIETFQGDCLVVAGDTDEDEFGEKGTITVGLACYNENPWYGIFQNSAGVGRGILSGIFAAFNPYKDVEWSWAFSSAKAGYKFKNEDLDRRDYMIDWKGSNQSWNLCQSDWDAVFVPVRRAVSKAEDGEWTYREGPPLDAWIKNGDWQPLKNSGGAYVVSNMPRLPGMNGSGSGINWNRVAEMLYH